jgi:hypothetical protein
MAEKKLILMNGRGWCLRNPRDPRWMSHRPDQASGYIAAHSAADAVRMIEEYNGGWPKAGSELRRYWHIGQWGNSMSDITPERGIWVIFDPYSRKHEPVRLV